MSSPDLINAVLVAHRVLENPKSFRVSIHEELAMADCLLGLCAELDVAEARPVMSASLAAAIATFIIAEDDLEASRLPDGYFPMPKFAARRQAFNTLKTLFETEFPHG
ncbi:MAG: hypothetical protein KIS86_04615 [Devosia sp.]|nr:hypothetical protein [Devosia sp.]